MRHLIYSALAVMLPATAAAHHATVTNFTREVISVDGVIEQVRYQNPHASILIKKAAGVEKGSGEPNRDKVGKLNREQLEEIAKTKEPDLSSYNMDAAVKIIAGTARSMGIETEA